MASRNPLNLTIQMNSIHCIDEGDGPGTAEPYLWTLFYKIDGESVRFGNDDDPGEQLLRGAVTVERRDGGHGNLLTDDVDEDDTVPIPTEIGRWETVLQPIPVAAVNKDLIRKLTDNWSDLPGLAGVVVILMEEDNLPDSSALAGYNAFCSTFETKMNELITTLDLLKLKIGITEDMENGIEEAVRAAVESAIMNSMNVFEAAWNWIAGPDQTLGSASFRCSHDDLVQHEQIHLSERWKNGLSVTSPLDTTVKEFIIRGPGRFIESGGEWEIFGTAAATPVQQFIGEFGPPVTFSQGELAIHAFRASAQTAAKEGYASGYPTFKTVRDRYSNEFSTTVFLKWDGAIWSNVEWFLLGMPKLDDFVAQFRAVHTYARKNGYAGGFPTFYERSSVLKNILTELNENSRGPGCVGLESVRVAMFGASSGAFLFSGYAQKRCAARSVNPSNDSRSVECKREGPDRR